MAQYYGVLAVTGQPKKRQNIFGFTNEKPKQCEEEHAFKMYLLFQFERKLIQTLHNTTLLIKLKLALRKDYSQVWS